MNFHTALFLVSQIMTGILFYSASMAQATAGSNVTMTPSQSFYYPPLRALPQRTEGTGLRFG